MIAILPKHAIIGPHNTPCTGQDERRPAMASLPTPGETISGFSVTKLGHITMLGADTVEFCHLVSGARLLFIQNDDHELGFNLIYRTPQFDETDTNHILEHLLLSSCGKYPSRDIFFDMDSKSYSTFMNGLTDNTYTCYPVCTQSQEQLIKLMDVYLCCMEDPDALKDKNFFLREALRLELEHVDGPLTMQGTVLSEDLGHLTDIQENADSAVAKALYQGLPSSNLLGRAHLHYKELTYEHVKEVFEQCYDYSNCLMVLYGDLDLKTALDFLDRQHLSHFPGKHGSLLHYMNQPVTPGHRILTSQSPAYEESSEEQCSIIDYAIDLTGSTQEELIYWDLFTDILDSDTSPWHRQAREDGINNVMEVYLDQLLPNPSLRFRLRNGDAAQKDIFHRSVLTALAEISSCGVADELYQAAMKENRLTDALTREGAHLGFHISEEIGRYWSQTGKTDYFELYETASRTFTEDCSQSILKQLAANVLKPAASALVVTAPCPGLAEMLEQEKELYLEELLSSMTRAVRLRVCDETSAFQRWNLRDWGNMDFLIKPEDLPAPTASPAFVKKQFGGITSYTAPAPVDAVGSYQIYFDLSLVPAEDFSYLSLYQMLLTELDTKRYTVEQQKTMEQEYLHDCTFDELYPDSEADDSSYPMMTVFWYGLTGDFGAGLDFLLDIMSGGDYEDITTITRVLEKYLPDYDLSKSETASSLAFSLAEGYIRQDCRFRNMLNSQDNYYFLKDVLRQLKEEIEPDAVGISYSGNSGFGTIVTNALRRVSSAIMDGSRLTFMASATPKVLDMVEQEAVRQLSMLGNGAPGPDEPLHLLPPQKRKLAICVEGPTQETRMMGDFRQNTRFKGRYLPFLMACADKHLKPAIRYQGGAYDSGIDFYIPGGYFTLWSTADPEIESTLELFANAGTALLDISLTQQDLNGYILNTYAQALPPAGTLNDRMRYMRRDMAGIDTACINHMIEDIKNAQLADQAEAAHIIHEILSTGPVVTVGNERAIMKDRRYFGEILVYKT